MVPPFDSGVLDSPTNPTDAADSAVMDADMGDAGD
jgi:hypothetical protein